MKRVLWISRHFLTRDQLVDLERFCGGKVTLTFWQENVEELADLADAIEEAQVIAAVLPIHLLAQLVEIAGEKPVLISMAKRVVIPVAGGEAMTHFTHSGWQRIKKLELALEPAE
jgi:hypothetical protein